MAPSSCRSRKRCAVRHRALGRDWITIGVSLAVPADAVEALEPEAEGIELFVASSAGWHGAVCFETLAHVLATCRLHGGGGIDAVFQLGNVGRRRRRRRAEHLGQHPNSAQGRRGAARERCLREEARETEEAHAMIGRGLDPGELCAFAR